MDQAQSLENLAMSSANLWDQGKKIFKALTDEHTRLVEEKTALTVEKAAWSEEATSLIEAHDARNKEIAVLREQNETLRTKLNERNANLAGENDLSEHQRKLARTFVSMRQIQMKLPNSELSHELSDITKFFKDLSWKVESTDKVLLRPNQNPQMIHDNEDINTLLKCVSCGNTGLEHSENKLVQNNLLKAVTIAAVVQWIVLRPSTKEEEYGHFVDEFVSVLNEGYDSLNPRSIGSREDMLSVLTPLIQHVRNKRQSTSEFDQHLQAEAHGLFLRFLHAISAIFMTTNDVGEEMAIISEFGIVAPGLDDWVSELEECFLKCLKFSCKLRQGPECTLPKVVWPTEDQIWDQYRMEKFAMSGEPRPHMGRKLITVFPSIMLMNNKLIPAKIVADETPPTDQSSASSSETKQAQTSSETAITPRETSVAQIESAVIPNKDAKATEQSSAGSSNTKQVQTPSETANDPQESSSAQNEKPVVQKDTKSVSAFGQPTAFGSTSMPSQEQLARGSAKPYIPFSASKVSPFGQITAGSGSAQFSGRHDFGGTATASFGNSSQFGVPTALQRPTSHPSLDLTTPTRSTSVSGTSPAFTRYGGSGSAGIQSKDVMGTQKSVVSSVPTIEKNSAANFSKPGFGNSGFSGSRTSIWGNQDPSLSNPALPAGPIPTTGAFSSFAKGVGFAAAASALTNNAFAGFAERVEGVGVAEAEPIIKQENDVATMSDDTPASNISSASSVQHKPKASKGKRNSTSQDRDIDDERSPKKPKLEHPQSSPASNATAPTLPGNVTPNSPSANSIETTNANAGSPKSDSLAGVREDKRKTPEGGLDDGTEPSSKRQKRSPGPNSTALYENDAASSPPPAAVRTTSKSPKTPTTMYRVAHPSGAVDLSSTHLSQAHTTQEQSATSQNNDFKAASSAEAPETASSSTSPIGLEQGSGHQVDDLSMETSSSAALNNKTSMQTGTSTAHTSKSSNNATEHSSESMNTIDPPRGSPHDNETHGLKNATEFLTESANSDSLGPSSNNEIRPQTDAIESLTESKNNSDSPRGPSPHNEMSPPTHTTKSSRESTNNGDSLSQGSHNNEIPANTDANQFFNGSMNGNDSLSPGSPKNETPATHDTKKSFPGSPNKSDSSGQSPINEKRPTNPTTENFSSNSIAAAGSTGAATSSPGPHGQAVAIEEPNPIPPANIPSNANEDPNNDGDTPGTENDGRLPSARPSTDEDLNNEADHKSSESQLATSNDASSSAPPAPQPDGPFAAESAGSPRSATPSQQNVTPTKPKRGRPRNIKKEKGSSDQSSDPPAAEGRMTRSMAAKKKASGN